MPPSRFCGSFAVPSLSRMPAAALHPDNTVWLHLAGAPQLQRQGRALNAGSRKALALALLVALEPGLRRARAADLLWPDAEDPAAARRNLRRDVFRLRQLGLALQDGAGDSLALADAELVWPLPGLVAPRWLDGLDDLAGAELSHWVELQRQQLQRRWVEHLAAGARQHETQGQTQAALQAWRLLLADSVAGPGHSEARAALQRLQPEAVGADPPLRGVQPPLSTPKAGPPAAAPFTGRRAEVAALRQALDRGQLVLLDGSPGVGKTRLAHEALAARGGALWLRCRPEDVAVPFASALRGLHTLRAAQPEREPPAWVRRDLAALLPDWAPRGAAAPESPGPAVLSRAYLAALKCLTEGVFASLVIDDWQWADESSQALWDLPVLARTVGLACVVVHRSAELPPTALERRHRWLDEHLALALRLAPLSAPEAENLLQQLALPALAGHAHLAKQLVQQAGGNPLFLLEIARHLAQHENTAAPASVQAVVVARVRALGPAVRRVLEAASLAGEHLHTAQLAAVLGMENLAVAHALEHATAAELLTCDEQGRHAFVHDLVTQAIADSLAPVRRQALHGRLAEVLQTQAAEPGRTAQAAEPGRIARHWELAQRTADAAAWHLRAAEVAVQRRAGPEALAACAAVLASAADAALRLQAWVLQSRAWHIQADVARAEAALQAALPDAVKAGASSVVQLGLERTALLSRTGRADAAMDTLAQLEGDPALQEPQRLRLLQERAVALSFRGQHAQSRPQLRLLLQQLPPSALAERLRLLLLLSRDLYWSGDRPRSFAFVEEALALARDLADEATVALCQYRIGCVEREQGHDDAADLRLREAAQTARRLGHLEVYRSALSTRCSISLSRMQLAEAEALILEGEQAAPHWDSPDLEDVYDDRRYRLHYLRGQAQAAWAVLHRSIERNRQGNNLYSYLGTLMQAVSLGLATGDLAAAQVHLDNAMALHIASGSDSMRSQVLQAQQVLLLQAQGRSAQALRLAQTLLGAECTLRVEDHALLLAAAAQAALDLGRMPLAGSWLEQALALPSVPIPVAGVLLAARLRHAGQGGEPVEPVLAQAREWMAQPVLPAYESGEVRRALLALNGLAGPLRADPARPARRATRKEPAPPTG